MMLLALEALACEDTVDGVPPTGPRPPSPPWAASRPAAASARWYDGRGTPKTAPASLSAMPGLSGSGGLAGGCGEPGGEGNPRMCSASSASGIVATGVPSPAGAPFRRLDDIATSDGVVGHGLVSSFSFGERRAAAILVGGVSGMQLPPCGLVPRGARGDMGVPAVPPTRASRPGAQLTRRLLGDCECSGEATCCPSRGLLRGDGRRGPSAQSGGCKVSPSPGGCKVLRSPGGSKGTPCRPNSGLTASVALPGSPWWGEALGEEGGLSGGASPSPASVLPRLGGASGGMASVSWSSCHTCGAGGTSVVGGRLRVGAGRGKHRHASRTAEAPTALTCVRSSHPPSPSSSECSPSDALLRPGKSCSNSAVIISARADVSAVVSQQQQTTCPRMSPRASSTHAHAHVRPNRSCLRTKPASARRHVGGADPVAKTSLTGYLGTAPATRFATRFVTCSNPAHPNTPPGWRPTRRQRPMRPPRPTSDRAAGLPEGSCPTKIPSL